MAAIDPRMVVVVRYTNYRGETAIRRIIPRQIHFVATEWHPEPQWVLEAFDLDRNAERSFAIKDIVEWCPTVDAPAATANCTGKNAAS
jgi:predicted DNA-binding transcriptional regulator YafY